jgi:hypothetical protein
LGLWLPRGPRWQSAAGLGAAPAVLSLPAVQRRLAPDEAILYCYWLDAETLLVAHAANAEAQLTIDLF